MLNGRDGPVVAKFVHLAWLRLGFFLSPNGLESGLGLVDSRNKILQDAFFIEVQLQNTVMGRLLQEVPDSIVWDT
jgi:hypothetical protein